MEVFSNWIRNVAIMVIILSFLELLLPQNQMERFVRAVIGLVIIAFILRPLVGLVGGGTTWELQGLGSRGWPMDSSYGAASTQYIAAGERLVDVAYEDVRDRALKRLSRQVEAVASMASGHSDLEAEVKLDARGEVQEILIRCPEGPLPEGVASSVARFYGLPESRVRVVGPGEWGEFRGASQS